MQTTFTSFALTLAVGCGMTLPETRTLQHESFLQVRDVDRCEALANRDDWDEVSRDRPSQISTIAADGERRAERAARTRSSLQLGATPAESQVLCERRGGRQTGQQTEVGDTYFECAIDGVPIYRAHMPAGAVTFDGVKKFYASADVATLRRAVEANIGGADSLVVERGCQVWSWTRDGVRVHLATLAGRVALTIKAIPVGTQPAEEALIMDLQY